MIAPDPTVRQLCAHARLALLDCEPPAAVALVQLALEELLLLDARRRACSRRRARKCKTTRLARAERQALARVAGPTGDNP